MRGTVVGERVVSQAQTREFDEGYSRTFGSDRKPQRGRWIWDEQQQRLVSADEYVAPVRALDSPIMVDRFYEGLRSTDGVDIGSRRKYREYQRVTGLAPASDFSPEYQARERARYETAQEKRRAEAVARELSRAADQPQSRYDRECLAKQKERHARALRADRDIE